MHPKNISIQDYTYQLPDSQIAYYPLQERDQSRLLIIEGNDIAEDIYKNIDQHIESGSLVVFNNTKVVEARLRFKKETGGEIEIFCLEPAPEYADITTAMQQTEKVNWCCLVGGASKWKTGQVLEKEIVSGEKIIRLQARMTGKLNNAFLIELTWNRVDMSFAELLHLAGSIPLPPYIKRNADSQDADRYQTIYAHHEGSVAAPTAGLHFTPEVMEKFRQKNIHTAFTTLHVGAGTFQPVKAASMQEHDMHAEYITIDISFLKTLLTQLPQPIIAVGTTSLRTLETIYWLGVKAALKQLDPAKGLTQWEVYDHLPQNFSASEALQALTEWMKQQELTTLITRTRLLIAPGYRLRLANGLVTNFHQPQSTLLLLVASIIGSSWKQVYNEALSRGFRFLSYGDGMFIKPRG